MYRLITVLLFSLVGCLGLRAQMTRAEADAKTYSLWEQGKWEELVTYGEQARAEGLDFYYLSVRLGLAYFNLNAFHSARENFERAAEKDPAADLPKQYLYWCALYLGQRMGAAKQYQSLPQTVMKTVGGLDKPRWLDFVLVEGGGKFSNKPEVAGNLGFFGLSLNHELGRSVSLFHAYNYLSQPYYWGSYVQQNYFISPTFQLNKKLSLSLGYHLLSLKGDLDLSTRSGTYTVRDDPPGPAYRATFNGSELTDQGELDQTSGLFYAGLTLNEGRFQIKPYVSLFTVNSVQNGTRFEDRKIWDTIVGPMGMIATTIEGPDTTYSYNEEGSFNQVQIGGDFSYTLPANNDGIRLGLGLHIPIDSSGSAKYAIVPSIGFRVLKKHFILLKYYNGNGLNIAEDGGANINNAIDLTSNRFSLTGFIGLSPKINWYLNYQFETREEPFLQEKYQLNSIFTGITFYL